MAGSVSVSLSQVRVVVIDPQASMRNLLRSLLASSDLTQTVEAADSQEGLKLIRTLKPDLVICDLRIRPLDGIAFTRYLRRDEDSPNPYQPILMIVGREDYPKLSEIRDAGVHAIVTKPVTVQNLMTHIVEIVEHPRSFIRVGDYFGPDRRSRPRSADAGGPWRRQGDTSDRR